MLHSFEIVSAGLFALVGASLVLQGIARSTRTTPSGQPAAGPGQAAFLFEGEDLVDALPAARRLLHRPSRSVSDLTAVLSLLSRGFGADLPARMADLPSGGHCSIPSLSGDDSLDVAREGAMLRLTFRFGPDSDSLLERWALEAASQELVRLRGIAEDTPHPIWATDDNGQVVWANQAYLTLADLTRVTPPDGAEESVLASPLWPAAPLFAVPADLSKERLLQWRETLALPDREEPMWFDVTTVRRGPGTLSFATDAGRLVLAEAARLHFVQALAKTFAHLSTGLVIFDRHRQLVLFNPAFVDLTGLPIAFLSGRPLVHTVLDRLREAKILPEPPDYASWRESVAALEAAAVQGQYADTWTLPNGRTYRVTGRPHPDGALAFLFEDISDEVGQTRRLRDELDAARAALDITGEAMAVFGATGAVILSSAAYGELWGSPRGAAGPGSLSTELARWEASCAPSPLLGQLRAGMRIGRQEGRLSRLEGDEWTLRIAPLPRGATLVTFHPLGATQYRNEPETGSQPTSANLSPNENLRELTDGDIQIEPA